MTKDACYKLGSGLRKYWWFFIIVLGLIIYLNVSDSRSLIEKCADITWKKYRYTQPNQKLKIKLSDRAYESYYAFCEEEQKRFPSMFKEKYN